MGWFWSGWGGCHGYGYFGWPSLIFYGVIFLIIGLIIWAIVGKRKTISHNSRALEILDERYANGEITDKEYREMKKKIRN